MSQVVKTRADIFRSHSFTDSEIAEMEIGLLHVSTSNTIPVTFWFLAHVLSSSAELIKELRQQLESAVEKSSNKAILNIKQLEDSCPLLLQCYNEALRISIHAGHFRRVLNDTVVSDGQGTSYTLKKGFDVLLSSDCSHSVENIWGSNTSTYNSDRFSSSAAGAGHQDGEKSRKTAFHPFGGGKHLCPGRNYANAEILGFVGGLILMFDITPAAADNKWHLPEMETAKFFEAAAKPVNQGNGFRVNIQRRESWKDIELVLKNELI